MNETVQSMTHQLRSLSDKVGDQIDADRLRAAADEIERLRDGLDAVRQYGSDTLSGPTKRANDTRDWQREAVLEMTNRAGRVLNGRPWKSEA